jgi:membrane protease YdiL (CAAX protease family)
MSYSVSIKKFAESSPYLFSLAISILVSLIAAPFVIVVKVIDLELEPLRLIIPIAQSAFVVWFQYVLGWLKATGFGGRIKDIHVLWFPLMLAFVPVVMFGTIEIAPANVAFYALALVFTGISEEGLSRGIILKALVAKGPWSAILFMSALFSVGHFTNLFFENFSLLEMVGKLLVTFSFALLYGAVFLRTLNIWPLIVLHAVHDFSFLTSGTAGPYTIAPFPLAIHAGLAVFSILYVVFIMRKVGSNDSELEKKIG